jgi:F0F1-type ATP synthase assembly protein I
MEHLVRISAIGSNFAFAVMGMGLIGWAIQKWLWPAAAPWPILIGLGLGLIGGLYRFVRDAMAAERDS